MHPHANSIGQTLTAGRVPTRRWMVIYPAEGGDKIVGNQRLVRECTPLEQAADMLEEHGLVGEFAVCWRDCCGREVPKMTRVRSQRCALKVTAL